MSYNAIIIASVNKFNQGTTDKNGKEPVMLNVLAGKCPNRNVISGTIAESLGIEVGKTYMFQVREGKTDSQYGRQFVYNKLGEMDLLSILDAQGKLGAAQVFDVTENADVKMTANVDFHEANK